MRVLRKGYRTKGQPPPQSVLPQRSLLLLLLQKKNGTPQVPYSQVFEVTELEDPEYNFCFLSVEVSG